MTIPIQRNRNRNISYFGADSATKKTLTPRDHYQPRKRNVSPAKIPLSPILFPLLLVLTLPPSQIRMFPSSSPSTPPPACSNPPPLSHLHVCQSPPPLLPLLPVLTLAPFQIRIFAYLLPLKHKKLVVSFQGSLSSLTTACLPSVSARQSC
jgi:hypothetical protein